MKLSSALSQKIQKYHLSFTGLQPGVSLAINPETVSTVFPGRNPHEINGLRVVTRR